MNDEIDKAKKTLNKFEVALGKGWFPGIEHLSDIDEDFLTDLKEKGFEITSIFDGFQVRIKKIGTEDEYGAFGESIEEAIDSAIPFDKNRVKVLKQVFDEPGGDKE